jgi:hypothetical protein
VASVQSNNQLVDQPFDDYKATQKISIEFTFMRLTKLFLTGGILMTIAYIYIGYICNQKISRFNGSMLLPFYAVLFIYIAESKYYRSFTDMFLARSATRASFVLFIPQDTAPTLTLLISVVKREICIVDTSIGKLLTCFQRLNFS